MNKKISSKSNIHHFEHFMDVESIDIDIEIRELVYSQIKKAFLAGWAAAIRQARAEVATLAPGYPKAFEELQVVHDRIKALDEQD